MTALAVAVVLMASLLLVHWSMRSEPLPALPLNVDGGLPLPEIGQISSVFSLTALFGAYFAIYLLLGIPALAGLAVGTLIALLLLRHWIVARKKKSFEGYLASIVTPSVVNGRLLALALAGTQCAYATSELLILKDLAHVALGIGTSTATFFAVATAIIGYFYVVRGGYMALFRTDVIQFLFVAAMGTLALIMLPASETHYRTHVIWASRPGYWIAPFAMPSWLLAIYHFALAMVMSFAFIMTSPDAWKRVHLVTRVKANTRTRFPIFILASALPFILLVVLGLRIEPIPDGRVSLSTLFDGTVSNEYLFLAIAVSLIGCFLSAFNSALLLSVHVTLVGQRRRNEQRPETPRFHALMAAALMAIFLVFSGFAGFGNAYLLGNFLLGPYLSIAAVLLATGAKPDRLPNMAVPWLLVLGNVVWFLSFVKSHPDVNGASTFEVNSIPNSILLFVVILVAATLMKRWRGGNASA